MCTHLYISMYSIDTTNPNELALPTKPKERAQFLVEQIIRSEHYLQEYNDGVVELDNILRIFLAPEWMFRNPSTKNLTGSPLSKQEMHRVIEIFIEASKDQLLKKWLIVPGSICWGTFHKNVEVDQNTIRNELHWYNTTPVIFRGELIHWYHKQHDADDMRGPYQKKRKSYTVVKPAIISHGPLDELTREDDKARGFGLPFEEWQANPEQYSPVPSKKARSPFFVWKGLRIAIETCRDFATETALRLLDQDDDGVDLHLVVAAGVPPGTMDYMQSVACKGGYLIICNSNKVIDFRSGATFQITERTGSVYESAVSFDSKNDEQKIQGHKYQIPQDCVIIEVNPEGYAGSLFAFEDLLKLPTVQFN